MAYIRFPDFTPSDNDLGSPRGHSNQLFIEVNKHIRALKDSVPNDGTNDGVEIVVHWAYNVCPPSIVRFKHGKLQLQWTEHLDEHSPKIPIATNAQKIDWLGIAVPSVRPLSGWTGTRPSGRAP